MLYTQISSPACRRSSTVSSVKCGRPKGTDQAFTTPQKAWWFGLVVSQIFKPGSP